MKKSLFTAKKSRLMNTILRQLVSSAILTEDEVKIIELEIKKTNSSVEDCVIKLGLVNRGTLDKILKNKHNSSELIFDVSLLKKIPYDFCVEKKCIPVFIKDNCLNICLVKHDINTLQEISQYIHFGHYKTLIYSEEEVLSLIEKNYIKISDWTSCIENLDNSSIEFFINRILIEAFTKKATDIHISCYQDIVKVRYRISGLLKRIFSFHKDYYSRVLVRLKVMFLVDITSCFKQRDGKMRKVIFGNYVDFRISFHNCIDGENIVIRIIRSIDDLFLKNLGYNDNCFLNIKKMISSKDGIIFFVGPTGSGKTTSMYVILKEIDRYFKSTKNIMTIEDPIESRIVCAQQTDINRYPDMNFINAMRSIYRQDPDVLMVGEVRDEETAKTVVQISMTGHLVITTLHAKDVFAVLDRLKAFNINVESAIDYIAGIVSQRLLPKKCSHCHGGGCKECEQLGYNGLRLITESLFFNDEVKFVLKRSDISVNEKRVMLKCHGYREMSDEEDFIDSSWSQT